MRLHDRAADRQPHAHAIWLGGVEGVEELFSRFRSNSDTGISHRNKNLVALSQPRLHDQLAGPAGDGGHRFETVDEQIDDDLLELDAIAKHFGETSRKVRLQRGPMAKRLALHE